MYCNLSETNSGYPAAPIEKTAGRAASSGFGLLLVGVLHFGTSSIRKGEVNETSYSELRACTGSSPTNVSDYLPRCGPGKATGARFGCCQEVRQTVARRKLNLRVEIIVSGEVIGVKLAKN
jgi:hypothetical protein